MKLLEGLVLLGILALFVWWQLRDVAQAQKESARPRAEPPEGSPPDSTKEPS